MRIFLIGYMGSGKSSIGPLLAQRLGFPFIETDRIVEEALGANIPEIFQRSGERTFREAEFMALQTTIMLPEAVISLGGGTPCSTASQEYLHEAGISVYLRTSAEILATRLEKTADQRPLLAKAKEQGLLSFIRQHLEVREMWYSQAELIVDTDLMAPEAIVERIAGDPLIKKC